MLKLGTAYTDIERAAAILKKGGIAAFPTETVYGLGADAFNTTALARVFEAKGRPRFDPLIVHIASLYALERLVPLGDFSGDQQKLLRLVMDSFWPGPLTLVLPKRAEVPDLATAGLSTVAVRFPSNTIAQQLIALSSGAVAAPSANRFGRLSPSRVEHVIDSLGDSIDCVIDGGPCQVGVESTVLELFPVPRILRFGGISREQIEAVIGPVSALTDAAEQGVEPEQAAPSPGTLSSHYAPRVPLYLHRAEDMAALPPRADEAYLFFSGKTIGNWRNAMIQGAAPEKLPCKNDLDGITENTLTLSETGNDVEAAANLFEYLHLLDKSGAARIHAEKAPGSGLGNAINDRLRRAAVKEHI